MGDRELINQLRNSKGWPTLGNAAADRIEALKAHIAKADALAEALVLMRNTYPYNPPCHDWQEKVEAHKAAKSALAAYREGSET
jgi:hypothetical protein